MKRNIDIDLNIINAVKGIVSADDDGEGKVDVNGIVDVDSKRNSNADVKSNVVVGINGNVGVKEIIGVDSFEHVKNNYIRGNRNVDPESNVDLRRNAFSDVKQNVNNVGLKGNVDKYFEGKGDVKGSVDDDDVKDISDGDVDVDVEEGTRVDSERNADVVVEGNVVIAEQIADKSSLTEPEIDILHDISDDSYEISDEEVNSFDLILKLMKLCSVNLENFSQPSESLSRSLLILMVKYSLKNRGGVISVP